MTLLQLCRSGSAKRLVGDCQDSGIADGVDVGGQVGNDPPGRRRRSDCLEGQKTYSWAMAIRRFWLTGHQEVCFRALGGTSLNTANTPRLELPGDWLYSERVDKYTRGDWRSLPRAWKRGHRVGLDDVLECVLLAISLCAPKEEFHRLPSYPLAMRRLPMPNGLPK